MPACKYTYETGLNGPQTGILSAKDQCRMYAYASYALEIALLAEIQGGNVTDPAAVPGPSYTGGSSSSTSAPWQQ